VGGAVTLYGLFSLATAALVAATGVAHLFYGNYAMGYAYLAFALGYGIFGFAI
jgi:hypothetical protein